MGTSVAFGVILSLLATAELVAVLHRLRASDRRAEERAATTRRDMDVVLAAVGAMRGELPVTAALPGQAPPGAVTSTARGPGRRSSPAPAPISLDAITEAQRDAQLTIEMARPATRPVLVTSDRLTIFGILPRITEGPMPAGDAAFSVAETLQTGE
jgi:hypothetical protein